MYSRKELAEEYRVGVKKIRKLLRRIGITHNEILTPAEYELFQQKIGKPRPHHR